MNNERIEKLAWVNWESRTIWAFTLDAAEKLLMAVSNHAGEWLVRVETGETMLVKVHEA